MIASMGCISFHNKNNKMINNKGRGSHCGARQQNGQILHFRIINIMNIIKIIKY